MPFKGNEKDFSLKIDLSIMFIYGYHVKRKEIGISNFCSILLIVSDVSVLSYKS